MQPGAAVAALDRARDTSGRSTRSSTSPTLPGGGPATYGGRYIFAHIDRTTYSTQIRLNYTFKPDLTLDFYGEPFAASGRYSHIGELLAARSRQIRLYGTDGTTLSTLPDGTRRVTDGAASFTLRNSDFNVQSFRSNLVLRWEWRAGQHARIWCGSRTANPRSRRRSACRPATCSARSAAAATISSPSRRAYWFSPNRPGRLPGSEPEGSRTLRSEPQTLFSVRTFTFVVTFHPD